MSMLVESSFAQRVLSVTTSLQLVEVALLVLLDALVARTQPLAKPVSPHITRSEQPATAAESDVTFARRERAVANAVQDST